MKTSSATQPCKSTSVSATARCAAWQRPCIPLRQRSNFGLLQRRAAATAPRMSLEESPWRQGGISRPEDRHEAEAERVAKQVMAFRAGAGPSPTEQQSGAGQSRPLPLPATLHSPIVATGGQGQPLAKPLRDFFTQRFSYDFNKVRIHRNPQANAMAEGLDANAFTIGKDIFLADGAFRPANHESMRTLAHELTHVVQQGFADRRQHETNHGHVSIREQVAFPLLQREVSERRARWHARRSERRRRRRERRRIRHGGLSDQQLVQMQEYLFWQLATERHRDTASCGLQRDQTTQFWELEELELRDRPDRIWDRYVMRRERAARDALYRLQESLTHQPVMSRVGQEPRQRLCTIRESLLFPRLILYDIASNIIPFIQTEIEHSAEALVIQHYLHGNYDRDESDAAREAIAEQTARPQIESYQRRLSELTDIIHQMIDVLDEDLHRLPATPRTNYDQIWSTTVFDFQARFNAIDSWLRDIYGFDEQHTE